MKFKLLFFLLVFLAFFAALCETLSKPPLMNYIITKIEPQKKNNYRFSLFSNDKFIIGVSDANLLKYKLRVGAELTNELLENLKNQEEKDSVLDSAFRFLARRQHSIFELRQKLQRKTNNKSVIETVVDELSKKEYLNDRDFAAAFMNEEIKLKKSGPLLLRKKLIQKGVNAEVIEELISTSYQSETQISNCEYLAKKKLNTFTKTSGSQPKIIKLNNYLKQKGYNWEICEKVINSLSIGENDEE